MATETTNFHLQKPDRTDFVNIVEHLNGNLDIIDVELKEAQDKADQAFQSASNGKAAIKTAITGVDPTVSIPTDATFAQLAIAIGQIKTGVDTEDATATAAQILANMTAYVKGVKVTGTAADNGPIAAETVNLTTQNQEYTIVSGFHSGFRKIKAVITNLAAGVIKAGVTVGGILGTFTADATATAASILSGKTAGINGSMVTGTMADKTGTTSLAPAYDGTSVAGRLVVRPQQGYYDGTANSTSYVTDANFIAANILSGKSIFGVAGSVIAGRRSASGTTAYGAAGTFYYKNGASTSMYTLTVSGLTFTPSYIIAYGTYNGTHNYSFYDVLRNSVYYFMVNDSSYSPNNMNFNPNAGSGYINSTGFCIPVGPGVTYSWVVIE